MQFRKIFITVLAVVCLYTSFSVLAYAETPRSISSIAPAYETANDPMVTLSISGRMATCTSSTRGSSCASISVTQTLQKYSGWFWIWNDVDNASWSKTVNANIINLVSTKSGLDSGTYRVKSVFELTDKNGKTETVTIYSPEKKVG